MEGLDARHALLDRLIDHAPTFPPASLVSGDALDEDARAVRSSHSFALARLVWPASRLGEIAGTERGVSAVLDASLPENAEIEAVEARYRDDLAELQGLAREVYVEVPVDEAFEPRLDAVAELGLRAKVRCGGAVVPSDAELAGFVRGCRERGLVFKATAGLHHAVRSNGEHGFLNLLAAVVFRGMRRRRSRRPTRTHSRSTPTRSRGAGKRRRFRARSRPARALPLDRQLQLLRAGRGAPGARDASPMTGGSASASSRSGVTRRASGSVSGTTFSTWRRTASAQVFGAPTLNPFLALGRTSWEDTIARIDELVRAGADLVPLEDADVGLPFTVSDYVDFYSSLEHATNLGRLFRPDAEPLLPNWRHLPVGYHGRAGTVVVSGTPIVRPCGQAKLRPRTFRASGRAGGSTSSSRSASSSESAAASASRCTHGGVPRPCLRRRPGQRLERA